MLIFIYSDNHVFSSENLMSDFAYTHSDSELIYTLTSKPIKKPKKNIIQTIASFTVKITMTCKHLQGSYKLVQIKIIFITNTSNLTLLYTHTHTHIFLEQLPEKMYYKRKNFTHYIAFYLSHGFSNIKMESKMLTNIQST